MYGGFGPHGHEGRSLFPLPPCFHSPSPLAKKRATIGAEETGWAEVGGVSTLLLDNASSVWFEDEGFFAWLCYGVGNDVEIECIRHSGNGPFSRHFGIFRGPKHATTGSKRAKNTCLSIPSGPGTTLEKMIFFAPGTLVDPPLAPAVRGPGCPLTAPSDH